MEKDLKILFQKYQEGKISLQEELLLSEKLSDLSDVGAGSLMNEDLFRHFEQPANEVKELKHVLHRVYHRIHLIQSERQRNKVYRLYRWSSKAAAILFIPLLAWSLFLWLNDQSAGNKAASLQLVAPRGARVNFELPDGTKGILNSESTLSYPAVFANNRQVGLSGEAWFEVAADRQHPFIVEANGNEIKVTGTKFSLSAYPFDKSTELVLEEGEVLFKSPLMGSAVELEPGQRLYEKDGKIEHAEVETWKYTAWKEGKLVFRNDSMEELARRLSLWYNVEVEIKGKGLEAYSFRGVFENDPLEEVLRLLKMTSPIDYEIRDRKARADGSFSRKQVMLTKKQTTQ